MSSLTSDRAMRCLRMAGRIASVFGLAAVGFVVFGVADARAGSRADFSGETATQFAAVQTQTPPVDTDALAGERAKGADAAGLPASDGSSTVAVILWDDAWSELQRRAGSAAVATAAANADSSLAGSSGN